MSTNISDKVECVIIDNNDFNHDLKAFNHVGKVLLSDLSFNQMGKTYHILKKYDRLTKESIIECAGRNVISAIILLKNEDFNFDFNKLSRKGVTSKMVNHILYFAEWESDIDGIYLGYDDIGLIMYGCKMDYFQRRSFDVLRTTKINPILKHFGLIMKRNDKCSQIVVKL